jgi:hypothetical protein
MYVKGANDTILYPPKIGPDGLTSDQHVKSFWKWIVSFPTKKNPWHDPTGTNCDNGQSHSNSSVFYLSGDGGGPATRTCVVPSGKNLFIPVSPMEISDKEAPKKSVADLNNIAKKDQDSITSLYLKIDNKEYGLSDLSNYRIHTGPFEIVFPKDAIFGVTEGPSKAVADGYYVITKPLDKGPHLIQYKSSLVCAGDNCAQPNFAQDVTYHITVK